MKYIKLALLSLLVSYSVVGQWNPSGNNTTTGSILLNSDSYVQYGIERGNGAKSFFGITSNSHEGFLSSSGSLKFLTNNNGTSYKTAMFLNSEGNVGIGTTSISEKLHLKGNLYVDSGVNDNKIYWNGHNMTMGTRPGAYTHNVFNLKPGGASQGLLFSRFNMYNAGSQSEHELKIQLHSNGNSFINSGNVGIGTSNPDGKLHVQNGSTGGIPHSFSDITLEHNDNSMISILTPRNKVGYFGFADEDDGWVAGMQYSHSSNAMLFRVNNHNSDVIINSSGNVGIGTTSPVSKLEVSEGDIRLKGYNTSRYIRFAETENNQGSYINYDGTTNTLNIGVHETNDKNLASDINAISIVRSNGNVGIGTTDTKGFKLGVNGDIAATKIKVALYDNWPDYVFEDAYVLPTLKEVENHINQKGHLQNVPSAKEVAENGFFLEEMDSKLLQKIEELTLYTIAQEKKIEEQEKKIENLAQKAEKTKLLEKQLLDLSERLEQLESK